MRQRLKRAAELLRRNLNSVPWLLIGSATTTPAFAATDIALDELRMPILLGSVVLLVVALALKLKGKTVRTVPQTRSNGFSEGIGRYRLQFGRGNSD